MARRSAEFFFFVRMRRAEGRYGAGLRYNTSQREKRRAGNGGVEALLPGAFAILLSATCLTSDQDAPVT